MRTRIGLRAKAVRAGGLLIGAVANQAPDLFRACTHRCRSSTC